MKAILIFGVTFAHKLNKDAFDEALGKDAPLLEGRGYDDANDYDREIEKPENVKWDDDSWKGFRESFNQIEKENMSG